MMKYRIHIYNVTLQCLKIPTRQTHGLFKGKLIKDLDSEFEKNHRPFVVILLATISSPSSPNCMASRMQLLDEVFSVQFGFRMLEKRTAASQEAYEGEDHHEGKSLLNVSYAFLPAFPITTALLWVPPNYIPRKSKVKSVFLVALLGEHHSSRVLGKAYTLVSLWSSQFSRFFLNLQMASAYFTECLWFWCVYKYSTLRYIICRIARYVIFLIIISVSSFLPTTCLSCSSYVYVEI